MASRGSAARRRRLYCLYLGACGAWTGEVAIFSKRVSGTVTWKDDPAWFIGTVSAWTSGGVFLFRLAVANWREGSNAR